VRAVLDALKLPIDETGRRRAAARAEWVAAVDKPLDLHDIIAGEVSGATRRHDGSVCSRVQMEKLPPHSLHPHIE
jgi:hypothetical protein